MLLRPDLEPADYLPLWRSKARELDQEAPTEVKGAQVRLDGVDRLYHLVADPAAAEVGFTWRRASAAARAIDYRTAFVLEGWGEAASATIEGNAGLELRVYPDARENLALLVIAGPQPAEPRPVTIRVRRTASQP